MSVNISPIHGPATFERCDFVGRLRAIALASLARMYRREEQRFGFCVRRSGPAVALEGTSRRYTAIVAIGLASESAATVAQALSGDHLESLCGSLLDELPRVENLGDVALMLWAAGAIEHPRWPEARRRLQDLLTRDSTPFTVELAWSLVALCHEPESPDDGRLRDRIAETLLLSFAEQSDLFPHRIARTGGLRGHVACFADLVYPIHALSQHHVVSGRPRSLEVARRCAERVCQLHGPDGQWWWHYDIRTGRVVERYPVYAVHQDAMAPMAVFALAEAGGPDHGRALARGLSWLHSAPELGGGSLIDESAGVIWRKVARREPRKLVRRLNALASRAHPALRAPGAERLFPPGTVDHESRPYHLGWLLYAWTPERAQSWRPEGGEE